MRPRQRAEVQKDRLAVLNLDVRHHDGLIHQDVVGRRERKRRPERTARTRRRLDRDRQTVGLARRDDQRLKDRFNPEDPPLILKACAFGLWGGVLASPRSSAVPPAKPGGVATVGAGGMVGFGGGVGCAPAESVVTTRVTKLCTFCPASCWRSTVLGSSSIACVIVPATMNVVRSCGIRAVLGRCRD